LTLERNHVFVNFCVAGKPIPTELKKDEEELRKEMELEPLPTAPETHLDDEYRKAGINDPKIVVTTSRDPSSRLTQFAKVRRKRCSFLFPFLFLSSEEPCFRCCCLQEMRLVFPNSQKINRGNYVIKDICDACRANEVTDLIIFHEHRGEPGLNHNALVFVCFSGN
jgi:U3 small nucleolar ribonucleoprotein protein IMP4